MGIETKRTADYYAATKRRAFVPAAVLALLVVFAVHFLDFPGSVLRFKELSGGGVLLDQSPSFTVDEIYKRFSDYGEAGRRSYIFRNLTVDIILPLGVLPFLFLLMFKAVQPLRLSRMIRVLLLSLPVAYVIFDFMENASVLVLLNNYPERMILLAGMLPYITSVKRAASLFAIFVPLIIFSVQFLRGKFQKTGS
jgi:hypothetical protein